MEKAKLENIVFDSEDAKLFKLHGDKILQAKAIKYSILPKLNVILEEALSRIRQLYGIEVFKENSIVHSWPNFRENRKNDLKFNYISAYIGIGGARLPIWNGLERIDKKPVKIIPYTLGFLFNEYGISTMFQSKRYRVLLTNESYEKYFDFLLKNLQYIQTVEALSKMTPQLYYYNGTEKLGIPFNEIIERYRKNHFYEIDFINTEGFPINYYRLNLLVDSFVYFYPIYDTMLKISQNKNKNFIKLLSFINTEYFYLKEEIYDTENENNETASIDNINEVKFIKPGIRWQVFDRDNFKCVACGKSANDGAILHVDHILPRSKGGKNGLDNYQTLCHLCNIGKSNKSNKDLRKEY